MVSSMREHSTALLQPDGAVETEDSVSVLQLEEQLDNKDGEEILDHETYMDYKPEVHIIMMSQSLRKK